MMINHSIRHKTYREVEREIEGMLAERFPFADFELRVCDIYSRTRETKHEAGHELWLWQAVRVGDFAEQQSVGGGIHYVTTYGMRSIHRAEIFGTLEDAEQFGIQFQKTASPKYALPVITRAITMGLALAFYLAMAAVVLPYRWVVSRVKSRIRRRQS